MKFLPIAPSVNNYRPCLSMRHFLCRLILKGSLQPRSPVAISLASILYERYQREKKKKTRGIKSSRVTNPWSMLQPNLNAVISIMFSVRPLSSVLYPAMSCWYWKVLMSFPNGSPRRRDLVDSENGRREKEALRMPRELFVLPNGFSLYRTRQTGRRR